MESNNSEEEERRVHSDSWRKFIIFSREKNMQTDPLGPHIGSCLCCNILRQIWKTLQKAIMMFVDALMIFEVV